MMEIKLLRHLRLLSYLLVALSTVGAIVAVQQHFLSVAHRELVDSGRVLDESFQAYIASSGDAVSLAAIRAEAEANRARTQQIYDGAKSLMRQVHLRQIFDIIVWGVVFVLSAGTLLALRKFNVRNNNQNSAR